MSRITTKKTQTRCTTCRRNSRTAIAEQAARGEHCAITSCDFVAAIQEAIEAKYRLSIVPKQPKNLQITQSNKSPIEIVRKK